MDSAPDYHYYTSDIGRIWPVNGTYSPWQRILYGFILEYHKTLLKHIRPGLTADEIMDKAASEMENVIERFKFPKKRYKRAAQQTLKFRGHLSHSVGMAVHDAGNYRSAPLKPGIVKTNLREILGEIFLAIKVPENIKVLIEVEDEFTSFPTDPVLIKRVLTNLIMNAIQAMENGGLLRISAVKRDDYAYISVQDTGVGIPEENRSKIFQPLFTTKAKGQGLGLAVCKRIIDALQGSITFQSEVGKGTTFTIKLPFKDLKYTSQPVVSTRKK